MTINCDYIIGTAQLGQTYGINQSAEINSYKKGVRFIDDAVKLNLKCFDTAPTYGIAEKIIGKSKNKNNIQIYTKVPKILNNEIKEVEKYFEKSLNHLSLSKIEGLLLHNYKNIKIKNLDKFIEKLYMAEKIKKFGISIYEEKDILSTSNINLIQIPGNVFNQKVLGSKKIKDFVKNNGIVQVRSIFIQGLIFKNNTFPKKLYELKNPIVKLRNIAKENGIQLELLAISVIKELLPEAIPILGFDNINQLKKLKNVFNNKIDSNIIYKTIDLGKKYESHLWDPRYW